MDYVLPPQPPVAVPVAGSAALFPVRRVYCVGRNYAEHAKEMGFTGREDPFFFCKPADAVLSVADGETANQKLVRAGMAMANREKRGRFLRDPRIDQLEREAKESGVGIWSEPNPVPPWKWRYDCWQQGQC